MHDSTRLWVAILAGGDGHRLESVTRDANGDYIPKQFCAFGGAGSLLKHAYDRAARLAPPHRIIVVVREAHRCWWRSELAALADNLHVIAQPANSGTGVAVLHAVSRALEHDPDSHFLVLPSDHEVDDERSWHETLLRAVDVSLRWPDDLVLVGAEPQEDPDFGWIVPGRANEDGSRSVQSFIEKPGAIRAARLARQGALCSTFVVAASARALLARFDRHAPGPLARQARGVRGAAATSACMLMESDSLPACDFSRDLLEPETRNVRVLAGLPCGWTDLGTPERLNRWLERRRTGPGATTPGHRKISALVSRTAGSPQPVR